MPEHLLYLYTNIPEKDGAPKTLNQIIAGDQLWGKGRKLRVCFFQGNRSVVTLIREVASEWNAHSSTKFDFGPATGWYNCSVPTNGFYDIRIGFSAKGFWSAVGTHAESMMDAMGPSMNFQMFNRQYSEARHPHPIVVANADPFHKAVIRHEFGHALGLLHEAAHPDIKCQDEIRRTGPGNVYEYYAQIDWTEEKVDRNLGFIQQVKSGLIAGDPDFESIMFYSFPPEILKGGTANKCYVKGNLTISKKDAAIVTKFYPPVSAQQLVAELDLKPANIKAMPNILSSVALADTQSRIVADLESDDTYIRRNARVRLSELLVKDATGSVTARLLGDLPWGSYRYQVGVGVALANTSGAIKANSATVAALAAYQKKTKDATLKSTLKEALIKLKKVEVEI